ncbi:cytokinin dehydrogenase [Musa troglodytarum]|uniref:cytokinin dehydrogenase n=1 Tax=Musa troglodytarum TaxID=320322 RepID=A0A9E7FNG2_9LILI|nr:cytokinin dehydrogenase [Musa troglodytarum]
MEFALFCTIVDILLLLLALCSPCKFIQSPMDFRPLSFLQSTNTSSLDFGRIKFNSPAAVLRPQSPKEISLLLSFLSASSYSKVTVAARGAGHSINGQAQALDGIVIETDSLPSNISIHKGTEFSPSYADVSGGALWIELLEEGLKFGLAPRSWTDYLYLSIGGTLSNGGISGQTFKYGPQISNVLQLDVVTGKGDQVTCSPTENSELFYAVLGGLGQFGIITRARILLQDAPHKVKWVRAFYDDFNTFIEDQELLVAMPNVVDYVEGFMLLNEQSLHSSSLAFPSHLEFNREFYSKSSYNVYFCIEFAIHDYQAKSTNVKQVSSSQTAPSTVQALKMVKVVSEISMKMSYLPSHFYSVEVSYFDFLNRVRGEEVHLRSRGLWEVPHPWLNMFVPKSGIKDFKDLLLDNISPSDFEGLVLMYPILRDKWGTNSSAVLPDAGEAGEEVVYTVGVLRSANPATCSAQCLNDILLCHRRVAQAASSPRIGAKQYLPHHLSQSHWQHHFGRRWDQFMARKAQFDPRHILGQGIILPGIKAPRP